MLQLFRKNMVFLKIELFPAALLKKNGVQVWKGYLENLENHGMTILKTN